MGGARERPLGGRLEAKFAHHRQEPGLALSASSHAAPLHAAPLGGLILSDTSCAWGPAAGLGASSLQPHP